MQEKHTIVIEEDIDNDTRTYKAVEGWFLSKQKRIRSIAYTTTEDLVQIHGEKGALLHQKLSNVKEEKNIRFKIKSDSVWITRDDTSVAWNEIQDAVLTALDEVFGSIYIKID